MKKEMTAEMTVYVCETPTHKEGFVPKGLAEKMFSVSKMGSSLPPRESEVRVACFSCRKAAEKAGGLQVYPLHVTLAKIAERAAGRKAHAEETESYFRSLGAKAGGILAAREAGRQEAMAEQGELPTRGNGRGKKDRQFGSWRKDLDNARRKGAARAAREAAALRNGREEED